MTTPSHPSTQRTSRFACFAALLTLAIPTVGGCSGADPNPLIGTWKFASTDNKFGPSACNATFVFTKNSATITAPPSSVIPAGSVSTMAVTYVTASPKLVAVITNAAGHMNYIFVDKDHMYNEDAWGKCNYERTS